MSYVEPRFDVQIALGKHPKDPPVDADWVSFGEPREFSFTRGRQDDLDAFEPGQLSVVLDNVDEDLDQLLTTSDLYLTSYPATPVRLVGYLGIDENVIFSGYTIDGFSPEGLRGGGVVRVDVTDWLGWANTVEMPDSQWAAWVQRVGPTVWIRGLTPRIHIGYADSGGLIPAWNMASVFTGDNANMYGDPTYPDYVDQNSTSIVTGSSNPTFALGDTGSGFGGLIMNVGDSLAQSGQWLAASWFRTNSAQSMTWGGSTWSVEINASGYLVANIDVGGFTQTATLSFNHADGVEHLWFLKVTSTGGSRSMKLYSDLGSTTTAIGAAAVSGGGVLNFRGLKFTNSLQGDFVYFDGSNLATIFAITSEDGISPSSWCGSIANPSLWDGDSLSEQVPHVIAAAAVPAPAYEVLTDLDPDMYPYNPGSTLAADIATLGDSYLGAAYMLRDGTLRVRDFTLTSQFSVDFDRDIALISDDNSTDTYTSSDADTFTRANSASIGGSWVYEGFGGALGIISNAAYVNSAPTTWPTGSFQQYGRDVTISCDFANATTGMGLMVRRSPPATGLSGVGSYIAIEQGAGTVNVKGYTDGVVTSTLGNTGADTLGTTLAVAVAEDIVTVQIDGGTVHSFTITESVHMKGDGVGLIYTNLGVLPANTRRWDNFAVSVTQDITRPVTRGRTGTRADRIVNTINVQLPSSDVYVQDAESQARYGFKRKEINSNGEDKDLIYEYVTDLLQAKKTPAVELGEVTLRPYGNQSVTNLVMRDVELERAVTYREATYRNGDVVLNNEGFRISAEKWDWSAGTDWTVTLKLVPS